MNSISKNSAITLFTHLLTFGLAITVSIILARTLGPANKGIYALIFLILGIMLKLGSLGIEAANTYFVGSKKYEIKNIVSNSLIIAFFMGVILFLFFFGIYQLTIFQNFLASNQINPLHLWLVVAVTPFSLFFAFLISIFLGREEIFKYNIINITSHILQVVLIIIFLLVLKKGIFGAIISQILVIIISTILTVFLITKITKIQILLNKSLLKEQTKYGLRAYFGNLTQFLNYRLDMFLVAVFLVPAEVGFYSIAVGIAEKLWMLPNAIATVLFPRVSSIKKAEADNITVQVARHVFLIMFILSIIIASLAKPVIKILYGLAFLPSVIPFLILLPGVVALGVAKTLTSNLAGRGKPQFGTYASFISLAVNIPLNLLLIPKWGISGAAFASSIAYIIATLVVIISFTKISKKPWQDILFVKRSDFKYYKNLIVFIKNKYFNKI
jgi:O-antigen/teichoic acid export membrane protein